MSTKTGGKRRGRQANKSGGFGEDIVHGALLPYMPVVTYKEFGDIRPVAVSQYPTPHPFRPGSDRAGKNDFMVFGRGKLPVFIQVKNQNVGGTVDEKISFVFDIARYAMTATPYSTFLLVLLGTYWLDKSGIIGFAKKKATELEMLCDGIGKATKAQVVVGPQELAKVLKQLHTERVL